MGYVPYSGATSGAAAQEDIRKILRRFGCEEIGFSDNFEQHEVFMYFIHRGRRVQMRASAKSWAAMYLKENPYGYRTKRTRQQYEADALKQGHIAIYSILRDWVKGQMTAVESGILQFEHVFMPFMLTDNGQTLAERIQSQGLLPAPEKKA